MNLRNNILSAELRFQKPLEEFFKSVYDEKSLCSHGIDHHRRVWNYAKELLLSNDNKDVINESGFPEKLIIACYLHDIGMSVDPGIKHGHHSRELCCQFLKNNLLKEADFLDVLRAIENHDNKEYTDSAFSDDLLTILSVADDLDAFGYTGIYRYLEIYLTRGTNPSDLGNQIIRNAGKRFENFRNVCGKNSEIINKYKRNFEILIDFFENYNEQIADYKFGNQNPAGYCGVVEIISKIVNGNDQGKGISYYKENTGDMIIKNFFSLINGLETDKI